MVSMTLSEVIPIARYLRSRVGTRHIAIAIAISTQPLATSITHAEQEARVVEEVVIKSDDSSPDRTLSRVAGLTVLSDGSIAFADPMDRRIRVYDSTGRFLRAFGRTGEAPGEISTIREFGSVADTLWIYDDRARRFSFFTAEGSYIRSVPFQGTAPAGTHSPRAMLHGDRVLFESTYRPQLLPDAPRVGNALADSSVFRVAKGAGQPIRIFRQPRVPAAMMPLRIGTFQAYTEQPFNPRVFAHVSSGAAHAIISADPMLWGGAPGVLRLHDVRPDGSITVSDVGLPAIPLTAALVDEFRTMKNSPLAVDATAQQRTDRESLLAALREYLYVPQHAPLAIQLVAGSDGSVWLRDLVSADLWRVVISGRVARTVRMPADAVIRQATANKVWAVRANADGVPEVVRFGLR